MSFYNLDYEEKRFIQLAKKNTRSYYEHHDQIPSSPGQGTSKGNERAWA